MKTSFQVFGIHCGSCGEKITELLESTGKFTRLRVIRKPKEKSDWLEIESAGSVSADEVNRLLKPLARYWVLPLVEGGPGEEKDEPRALVRLKPLFLVFGYLFLVASLIEVRAGAGDFHRFIGNYMAGFFLIFSFFKFLNWRGFADAFAAYDLIAKRIPAYGRLYPLMELAFGIGFLLAPGLFILNALMITVTLISLLGVVRALTGRQKIQCACLGTVFDLPMTQVTLIENILMLAMGLGMLL